jgi:hypothetical protein
MNFFLINLYVVGLQNSSVIRFACIFVSSTATKSSDSSDNINRFVELSSLLNHNLNFMCKQGILFIFISLLSIGTWAQAPVQGYVKDSLGLPIVGAAVQITSQNGMTSTEIVQVDGTFTFRKLALGDYKMQVTAIGFQPKSFVVSLTADKPILSYPITLLESSTLLNQVNITAQKQLVEYRDGKIIVNVEQSVLATGNTVLEIFNRAPGVEVHGNTISILGKPNTVVYIDGKSVYVTGEQLTALLQGMSAEQVSAIEIIKNPSSKYDVASGNGIINIKTKRNPNEGMNGIITLNYGQGFYAKSLGSLHLNYRNKRVNIYTNYTYNQSIDRMERPAFVNYFAITPSSAFYQAQLSKIVPQNHSVSAGIDFQLNPKNTLSFMTRQVFLGNRNDYETNTQVKTAEILDSIVFTNGMIQMQSHLQLYNLNLKSNLDSNSSIDCNLDYVHYQAESQQNIQFRAYNPDLTRQKTDFGYRNELPTTMPIFGATMDYTRKINESVSIEAGLKLSQTQPNNQLRSENRFGNSDWQTDTTYKGGTQFNYQERLAAAYVQLAKKWKNVEWQLGGRIQQVQMEGHTEMAQSDFKNNYLRFFPSTDLKYTLNKNHQFRWSYTTTMNRPSYNMLTPFTVRQDPYTASIGNPFVVPSYTTDIELQYIFKSKYIAALEVELIKDRIEQLTIQDYDRKQLRNVLTNIELNHYYRFYCILPVSVNKYWVSNNTFNLYRIEYKTQLSDGLYHQKRGVFYINSLNTFTINKQTKAEVHFYYRLPSLNGAYQVTERYYMNVGLKRTILDGKGSLSFTVSDVFKTNNWKLNIDYLRQRSGYSEYNDTRVFKIVFSYKFGSKQFKNHKERASGLKDEAERIR